jgi:N-acetylglucosamine kinase-like BadF-type ATPase
MFRAFSFLQDEVESRREVCMKYVMGLDVGGSKTDCLIGDETGLVCGYGCAGSGSYEYHGVEAAFVENKKAVDSALADAGLTLGDIGCVGMGVAGADLPDDFAMLEREIYEPIFGGIDRVFLNDSFAALRGGARASYGLVIACGTGVIAAGISPEGARARAGGWMPEYGDKCTGETLGLEGLKCVWRAREGITGATLLTDLFLERSECGNVDEFFYRVYTGKMSTGVLQPMAQLVFRAGVEGDAAACDILDEGGRYLGAMLNAVARRLSMCDAEFGISMAGSVFSEGAPVLRDAMEETVLAECSLATFHKPLWSTVVGALLLGYEKDGPISEAVCDRLAVSLDESARKYSKAFRLE